MGFAQGPLTRIVSFALLVMAGAGCDPQGDLDTDAPWPNDIDSGVEYDLDTHFNGVVVDMSTSVDSTNPSVQATLSAVAIGDEVTVTHSNVLMAPCDDFEIEGVASADELLVDATYQNIDCGEAQLYELNWSFQLPAVTGEWTLQVGDDSTTFEAD